MPDTLSLSLTPGYLPADGELIDNSILRLIARPSIALNGSIGSATISDGAVTTAKLADGALSADTTGRNKMADEYVTASKLNATQDWTGKTLNGTPTVTWSGAIDFSGATFTPPPGMLVQQVHTAVTSSSTIAAATPGGTIPTDDTIPQNNEGTELLTLAITPKSATSILEITFEIPCACNTSGTVQVAALFQDSTANALGVTWAALGTNEGVNVLRLTHRMVSGTASATTFKVRVGTSGGTVTINGQAGSRQFGGIMAARLFIKEITA